MKNNAMITHKHPELNLSIVSSGTTSFRHSMPTVYI
uniref:Uncharacterized protein n=1 Tax=Anguilla anguilla TaxID=7936 RepID=A0A0E9TYN4_ANGAN